VLRLEKRARKLTRRFLYDGTTPIGEYGVPQGPLRTRFVTVPVTKFTDRDRDDDLLIRRSRRLPRIAEDAGWGTALRRFVYGPGIDRRPR
jgi:hypothetical protein